MSVNHERKVTLSQRRKRKLNADSTLLITRARVTNVIQSSFDEGFDARSHLRLTVGAPRNLYFQRNLSP